jgi:hypothetical protein
LQKDQVHRNGDPDFIYRKLLPVMKKNVRLFLNNDEPRSRSFSKYNDNIITYGVEKHSESFIKDDSFVTMACSICHGAIEFDYYNNDGMGKFSCSKCGAKNGQADYVLTGADFDKKEFFIKDVKFKMPYNIPYMLYNYVAAVAVAKEIAGITLEESAKAFETFKNVGGRYEILKYEDKTIKYLRIKQENPETVQTSINIIAADKTPKMVCIGMGHIPDAIPSYTNTFYSFDCDFSTLVDSNVERYLFFTDYVCYDAANRLIYEGVSPEKIEIIEGEDASEILSSIKKAHTDNIYLITWLHTFEDMQKQAKLQDKEEV